MSAERTGPPGSAMAYRLEPVRGLRERAAQGARGVLAGAVGDARATAAAVDAAVQRTAAARALVSAARATLTDLLSAGATPAVLTRAERYVVRRRAELDLARTEEARARDVHAGRLEVVDAGRAQLAAARADQEVIERHFARWRETQRKAAERRDD